MVLGKLQQKNMYNVYIECERKTKTAVKLYKDSFADQYVPNSFTFKRIDDKFEVTLSFESKKRERRRPIRSETNAKTF